MRWLQVIADYLAGLGRMLGGDPNTGEFAAVQHGVDQSGPYIKKGNHEEDV